MENEKARVEILLEDIKSKVELVVEGHSALREGQVRIEKRLDAIEKREAQHYLELNAGLNHAETALKGEIGRVENRIGGVEKRLGKLEKKVDRIDKTLDTKLAGHEKRLRKLERRSAA